MGIKLIGEEALRAQEQKAWQRRLHLAQQTLREVEKAAASARAMIQALEEVAPECPHWVEYWITGRHGSDKGDLFYRCTTCGETFRDPSPEFLDAREVEK